MSTDPNKMASKAIEVIEKWKNEAECIPENGFRTVVTRCFEALKSMNGCDIVDLQFHVCSMRSAREIARNFDKNIDSKGYREYYYGMSETIEKVMETLIERLKEKEKEGLLPPQTPTQNFPQPLLLSPNSVNATPAMMSLTPSFNNVATPSHNFSTTSNNFATPPNNFITPIMAPNQSSTPRSKSNSIRTLKCIRCPVIGLHISGFVNHLRNAHNTTPGIEKIGFKCGCGFKANSYKSVWEHSNKCKSCTLSVFSKTD